MNQVLLVPILVLCFLTSGTAQLTKRVNIGGEQYNCRRVQKKCEPELLKGEACATNGRTFSSLCELIRFACDFDLDEEDKCKSVTPNETFGTEMPTTAIASKCQKCSGATGQQVCSNESVTYRNECWLRRESCKRERRGERGIEIKHEGKCEEPSYSSDDDSSTWMHGNYEYDG